MAESEDVILRVKIKDRLQAAADLRAIAKELETVGKATDKTTVALGQAERATRRGTFAWGEWNHIAQIATGTSLGQAINSLASSMFGLGESVVVSGVKFNAFQESSRLAFTNLLGNAGQAHTLLAQLQQLNLQTPFQLPQLEQAAQQLLAVGFNAKELVPTMRSLANLAAVNPMLGGEGLDRAAVVLGQIRSTGRLMAQDALQLTSLGIPVWQILATRAGTTVQEIRRQSEAGLISGTSAISAILAYSDKHFAGAAAAQAKTFDGLMSNLTDEWQQFTGMLLLPVMKPLEDDLQRINAYLVSPAGKVFAADLSKGFSDMATDIKPLADGMERFSAALVIATGPKVKQTMDDYAPIFQVVGDLLGVASYGARGFADAVQIALDPTRGVYNTLNDIKDLWNWLGSHTDVSINLHYHGPGSRAISRAAGGIGGGIGGLLGSVPALDLGLPFQAAGGVTQRAGWSWVGERGPELRWMPQSAVVAPIERAQQVMSAAASMPRDLHIHVETDGRELAHVVLDRFDEMLARR